MGTYKLPFHKKFLSLLSHIMLPCFWLF
jgi:hypothetical protein